MPESVRDSTNASGQKPVPPFVVVAVTYGRRWRVLREVLAAARAEGAARAIVIDNAAADPIERAARQEFGDFVTVLRAEENTGSAGGFDKGLSYALEAGADYLFLLDDDNKPRSGCLRELWRVYQQELAGGQRDKTTLATLAFRSDYQPELMAGADLSRVNNRPGSTFGFHVLDLPFKVWRRLPWNRKRSMDAGGAGNARLPDRVRVDLAPWGGLFVHRSLIERFGQPNTGLMLYNDDFDYTWRITAAGGAIFLCPAAKVDDIDTSWNVKSRSSNSFDGWLTNEGDFRAYYSARNQTYFERHSLPWNAWWPVNRFVFLSLLHLRAWMKGGCTARLQLLKQAMKDGQTGQLGVHPSFPLASAKPEGGGA